MTGVDGEDASRPVAPERAREAARRGAQVERRAAGERHVEQRQRGVQLRLAAQHGRGAHDDRGVARDHRARVRDDPSIDMDVSGDDRRDRVVEIRSNDS
jgi:hypothetical protein